MLLGKAEREAIAAGRMGLVLRRWKRPSVKAGGTLVTAIGQLAIDAVERIDAIAPADAICAGYPDAQAAADALAGRDGDLYRIAFHLAGPDPRVALREAADLDDAERRRLAAPLPGSIPAPTVPGPPRPLPRSPPGPERPPASSPPSSGAIATRSRPTSASSRRWASPSASRPATVYRRADLPGSLKLDRRSHIFVATRKSSSFFPPWREIFAARFWKSAHRSPILGFAPGSRRIFVQPPYERNADDDIGDPFNPYRDAERTPLRLAWRQTLASRDLSIQTNVTRRHLVVSKNRYQARAAAMIR